MKIIKTHKTTCFSIFSPPKGTLTDAGDGDGGWGVGGATNPSKIRQNPRRSLTISKKLETLKHYKFAICYENVKDIPGYITEKIFDCFLSGCIPIYWGANNITDHIPRSCFIDKRNFDSYEKLYAHLTSITEKEQISYLYNIDSFLQSEKAKPFSSEYFAQTISNEILS